MREYAWLFIQLILVILVLGSILNVADQALTIERWHEIIGLIQDAAMKKTRLGIPVIYGIDSIHGAFA